MDILKRGVKKEIRYLRIYEYKYLDKKQKEKDRKLRFKIIIKNGKLNVMNKVNDDEIVTKGFFKKELKIELKKELKQELRLQSILFNTKFDDFKNEMEEKATARHNEIFNLVDGLAGEVKDNREFRTIAGSQISLNTQRIEKLEKKVFT